MNRHQSTAALAESLTDERLRPFLPLIYSAWSDGELSDAEIEDICSAVARHPGVDVDCQVALRHWLDPKRPPSPQQLDLLRLQLSEWTDAVELQPSGSATDLGIAIAEATRPTAQVTDAERAALAEVDSAIGLVPVSSPPPLRGMFEPAATFEPAVLGEILDGRHSQTRRKMRELLARPEFAYPDSPGGHDYRELVLRWTESLADEGLGTMGYPPPYGAGDLGAFVAAFAVLGYHDLSLLTKFGVQFGLFGGSIARLGTADHHARYLADVGSLALPGCFAMTETGHGSNVRDLETRAVYDPTADELVVTTPHDLARKDYIGNAAAHGRLAVVFARLVVDGTDHGVHGVLVPLRAENGAVLPGIRIEDNAAKGGLNGIDNGRIWFDDVRVPRTALLDRFAAIDEQGVYESDIPDADRRFFTMIGTLVGGRISVGAASVSVAKSALTIAVRYAHRRRQFGPSAQTESLLIGYPTHQRRLIPRLATTFAYHFAFESLIDDFADGTADPREIEARAAGLKAFASWHTIETIQASREACGGQGFLAENRLTTLRADADVFTTYEGDNTVLTQLVAKGLLSDFRHQFESMGLTGTVRYLLHRVSDVVTEANPMTRSTTDVDELLSPSWQLEQLRWRESHQVESLALRIKKRLAGGMEPFAAFVQVQTHAAAAARSHVEQLVLSEFVAAVEKVADHAAARALDKLRELHGLATIRQDLAWFQEHGHMRAATATAIRRQHDRLASELAAESLALVDSFLIPDELLAAPIATREYVERHEHE